MVMTAKSRIRKPKRADGQTTLTISLPDEVKQMIESAAKEDQRSVSNFLVVELQKLIAARKGGSPTDP